MGLKGFRDFITRGNLVELAVAFIIGVAFAALLKAFIGDLITPILAAFGGSPNFGNLSFTINNSNFLYGDFIDALLTFLLTAAVVYYFVVLPYQQFRDRYVTQPPPPATTQPCPYCLSDIPMAATRCPFCTSQLSSSGVSAAPTPPQDPM
jgi:large conductance mechanosensitive channel